MVEGSVKCSMEQVIVTYGDNQSIAYTAERSAIPLQRPQTN
jgi:hypothetical protein